MCFLQYHCIDSAVKKGMTKTPLPPIALNALQLRPVCNPGIVSQLACPVLGAIHITATPCDSETTLTTRGCDHLQISFFLIHEYCDLISVNLLKKNVISFMEGH